VHPDTPHPDATSVPDPTAPLNSEPADEAAVEAADSRPNRAERRGGKRANSASSSHGHGPAPQSRGAQGRRVNPVRRPG
jgi:hypothetical protein